MKIHFIYQILRTTNLKKSLTIHSLIANAFIEKSNYSDKLIVDHILLNKYIYFIYVKVINKNIIEYKLYTIFINLILCSHISNWNF